MEIILVVAAAGVSAQIVAMVLIHAKRKRPSESWPTWYIRCMKTYFEIHNVQSTYTYYNVIFHCKHTANLVGKEQPGPGDLAWCPAHNGLLGPAILTAVAEIKDRVQKTDIFAELY